MNNSIRWLLTETKLTSLDTNSVNITDNKLICYHLTSKQKWIQYNEFASRMDKPPIRQEKEILPTDTRAQAIVKRISNASKNQRYEDWQIEELVVEDLISDPYTDTSGFTAGGGDYHGKGLYTCYKFNPSIAYIYGEICLVFEVDISNFLITFEDLAKQVHGENWKIKDQLLKFYLREERTQESIEKYKSILSEIPDSELETSESFSTANERTAEISLILQKKFTKSLVTSMYDGIVLFGRTDGPVCVSFYPKYDAKLIGLGRLNQTRPEVVDWYDSLDDFVGGRAKLKQDFETLNSIAEENTDPQEKEEMKKDDRTPFDMAYVEITNFISKTNSLRDEHIDNEEFFKFYQYVKSEFDNSKYDFFLSSFKNSRLPHVESIIKSGQVYNDIIDETIKLNDRKKLSGRISYFLHAVFNDYVKYNIRPSDFFMMSCVKQLLNKESFVQDTRYTREFYEEVLEYVKNNDVSEEVKNAINIGTYQLGPQIVVSSCSIEKIANFYKDADDSQKNEVVDEVVKYIPRGIYPLNWAGVTPENHSVANELLENVIREIKSQGELNDYGYELLRALFNFLPEISYFSSDISEYLAGEFLKNASKIKKSVNTSFFANIFNYLRREVSSSHPTMVQLEELVAQEIKAAEDDINKFLHNLRLGVVTKKQMSIELEKQYTNATYSNYLSRQSSEWFANFVKLVISNAAVIKQVLGKRQADYIISLILGHDIVLTKAEQFKFTRKIGKSHYNAKNDFASYKHIDPDVFIELLGPDMQKGGMGAGLSFKGFEYTPGVYRLLYNHRKIVDFFCDIARPGLMKMIILNLNDTLVGHPNPPHTWGQSGMLKGANPNFSGGNLPFINHQPEEARISEIVNMDDIAWFEYFISRAKKNPKRGVAGAISTLEMNLNDKKSKMQASTSSQTKSDLEPKLDLSHRKIVGNSLKEVYNF